MEERPPILQWKVMLVLLAVVVVAVALASALQPSSQPNKTTAGTTYSQAIRYAERGQLTNVVFQPTKQEIDATLKDGTKIAVNYPTDQSATQFQSLLQAHHVKFNSSGGIGGWTGYVPLHGKVAAQMAKCMQHSVPFRKVERCVAAADAMSGGVGIVDTKGTPNRR